MVEVLRACLGFARRIDSAENLARRFLRRDPMAYVPIPSQPQPPASPRARREPGGAASRWIARGYPDTSPFLKETTECCD